MNRFQLGGKCQLQPSTTYIHLYQCTVYVGEGNVLVLATSYYATLASDMQMGVVIQISGDRSNVRQGTSSGLTKGRGMFDRGHSKERVLLGCACILIYIYIYYSTLPS